MDTNKPQSPFMVLQIVHGAMCLSIVLFLAVTMPLKGSKAHTGIEAADSPLLYIGIIVAAIGVALSNFMFQKNMTTIDLSAPLDTKLPQYTTACITRYAIINGAAIFNVVAWYLTGNTIPAMLAAAIVLLLISIRPVKSKVVTLLQVSYPDTLD